MKQILTSNKQRLTSVVLTLGMLLSPAWSRADIYITGATDGTFTFNGSFDISAYAPTNGSYISAIVRNNTSQTRLFFNSATGGGGRVDGYFSNTPFITTAHPYFNSTTNNGATLVSHTGDSFGFGSDGGGTAIFLPQGYVSGTEISGTTTFNGGNFGFDFNTPYSFLIDGSTSRIFLNPATATAPPATTAATTAPVPAPPVILVDTGAIQSTLTSGLAMPHVQNSMTQNASQAPLRNLNNRLFRSRGRTTGNSGGVASSRNGGDVTARFLNFANAQNIDYRVALGLRDGEPTAGMTDTLAVASSPFAMIGVPIVGGSSVTAVTAAPAGSGGKESIADKVVIDDFVAASRFELFSEFDYGFYEQDRLSQRTRGYEIDSYAASVGGEYRMNANLSIGAVWTYTSSDAKVEGNLGDTELTGGLATVYATAFRKNTWADLLYSYGSFDHEISRNTLTSGRARGETESDSHTVALNLGHNFQATPNIVTGPSLGLDYATGNIDGYAETSGGNSALIFGDNGYESMTGRMGWQATHSQDTGFLGLMTTQVRAGWAHEFMPETDTFTATLANSPFILVNGNTASRVGDFTAEGGGEHVGQDWLEAGTGVRFDFDGGWNLSFDYDAMIGRNNASAHFGSAKIGYAW